MRDETKPGPGPDLATMDPDQTREAWDALADGYDELVTDPNMAIAEVALRRARLEPGMRVLDVACGSGALSVPAARLGADVLGVDLAPGMVERLEARARTEGLSDVEGRVMDGHDLDLGDDTFDLAASQFGLMGFPDLPRGLAEMVRVTKPGGTVLLVVAGPPQKVEFLGVFLGALKAAVPGFEGPPMDPPPLPFQLSDPEVLTRRLADAGLKDIRVEPADHALEFRSAEHLWDWVTKNNPIGAGLAAELTDDQREAALAALEYELLNRSNGNGTAVLDNLVYTGIGTKS